MGGEEMSAGSQCFRRFSPIPFTHVSVEDEFWAPRLRVNRERTLFAQYEQCRKTGRIDAFKLDWKPGMEPVPHMFWDSDVAKWIEAASYSLATHPDEKLAALVDEVVSLVVGAQRPDGYLNAHFTVVEPDKRWTNLRDNHELYTAGHLIEAAVAHYQATGKRTFLEAMCRFADCIARVFGTEAGKKRGYCGHEEIELAVVKLYRATGEKGYLELSRYFVEQRGRQPHYFDLEARERGEDPAKFWARDYFYCQAHAPVREQKEAAGHAVRAMYLYSAMADLAAELNDPSLLEACERLWESVCLRKMYVTGGVGSVRGYEGFGPDYDLANEAYAETCAAIGLVLFCQRMLQFDCDSRYADVMERALYNGVISGVSLDGERYFYENPLVSDGTHHRQEWFPCACCPSNLSRLLASLGTYAYSQPVAPGLPASGSVRGGAGLRVVPKADPVKGGAGRRSSDEGDAFAVHLYIAGRADTTLPSGAAVTLRVETRYPEEGAVHITVEPGTPCEFELRLRIPGWCRKHSLAVNGEAVEAPVERGYACVKRTWHTGDVVELELDMPVERVKAHPNVQANRGRVALQRGPLVYCLEQADHSVPVRHITLPDDATLAAKKVEPQALGFPPDPLPALVVLEGEALAADPSVWQNALYRRACPPKGASGDRRRVPIRAVPYFAWDNRAPGEMVVWLPKG